MAVVKPLVFYDDTKRIEYMRAADTAPAPAGSGIARSINVIAVNTTAESSTSVDYIYLCSGTITLSSIPVNTTNRYTIKNIGTGVITGTPVSGLIEGAASISISAGASVDLISDLTNLYVL